MSRFELEHVALVVVARCDDPLSEPALLEPINWCLVSPVLLDDFARTHIYQEEGTKGRRRIQHDCQVALFVF